MVLAAPLHRPYSPPSDEECVALGIAARYLLRAGTIAVVRLLHRRWRADAEAKRLVPLGD